MSVMTPLQAALEREEGRCYAAYPDPLTGGDPWTIGIGTTGPSVKPGVVWNDAQIDRARDAKIVEATVGLSKALPWFASLDDARRGVLVLMAYQMGVAGVLRFRKMLAACRDQRYVEAAEEMGDSLWAHQTERRCRRMQWQMERGEWFRPGAPGAPP